VGSGERFRREVETRDRNVGPTANAIAAARAENERMKNSSMPRRWQVAAGPRPERVPGAMAIRRYRLVPLAKASKPQPPKALTA
jgi:hypothetical protein